MLVSAILADYHFLGGASLSADTEKGESLMSNRYRLATSHTSHLSTPRFPSILRTAVAPGSPCTGDRVSMDEREATQAGATLVYLPVNGDRR